MSSGIVLLDIYYSATALTLPDKVQDALRMIGAPDKTRAAEPRRYQLLALRRYLRMEERLEKQWVWSDAQIVYFNAHSHAVREKVNKVVNAFETANPGYTLGTSPVRSLSRQVHTWNHNAKVLAAANDLLSQCIEELSRSVSGVPVWPETPSKADISRFRLMLKRTSVTPEPTSAAPGTSDHGQMHAIDFVVMQGTRTIAGTDSNGSKALWDHIGWTRKLHDAVDQADCGFVGPLAHPYEPWHYRLP